MPRTKLNVPDIAEAAPGLWSNAIRTGDTLYIAGQVARPFEGGAGLVGSDEYTQAKQIFARWAGESDAWRACARVSAVLAAVGSAARRSAGPPRSEGVAASAAEVARKPRRLTFRRVMVVLLVGRW